MGFEVLGIIPARGGSKGVLRKNIHPVAGKPLIAWTWEAAAAAHCITRLVVSTDDEEIADLARSADIEVPFLRPARLASDQVLPIDVIVHTLQWLEQEDSYQPDLVLWLQPTSPLRTSEDIETALTILIEKSADSVVSVCSVKHHPLWMKRIAENGLLLPWEENSPFPQRRQDLSPAFCLNGAIYLTKREVLLTQRIFYPEATYAYVMPPERSLDVDSYWDLNLADLILKNGVSHQV